jgi:beta-lactamase regulating signal transducer with metallopeptidase domain
MVAESETVTQAREAGAVMSTTMASTEGSVATAPRVSWQEVAAGIWALGVLGVAGWLMGSQWVLGRWVSRQAAAPEARLEGLFESCCERMSLERRVGLVELPGITTAAVWGWLRPVVLIPANLRETHSTDEIRGILLHELAHVKRWDVLWSWFGLAACALHWFNPFAWLALRRFHADRELDCDRMALENLTAPQRSAYAPALLKTLESAVFATPAALVPFFRNKHEIHTRILTIMKPAKSLAATLAALLVIPALTILSLTKASADGEQGRTGPRDGEVKQSGPRDGEVKKEGPRDGETKREGARDGESRMEGSRDGDNKKDGARDGEMKKEGAREGDGARKTGARDGEGGARKGPRDGDGAKKSGDGDAKGEPMVLRVLGNGESVSVNGKSVPMSGLRGYLNEHLAGTGASVVVEAEDTVPYKAVMNVLDAARDNGAKGARLAANEGGREGGKTKSAEGR